MARRGGCSSTLYTGTVLQYTIFLLAFQRPGPSSVPLAFFSEAVEFGPVGTFFPRPLRAGMAST